MVIKVRRATKKKLYINNWHFLSTFSRFFVLFHGLFVAISNYTSFTISYKLSTICVHVEWIPFLNQCHRNNIEKSCFYYLFEWQLNRTSHCVCVVCACECDRGTERVREWDRNCEPQCAFISVLQCVFFRGNYRLDKFVLTTVGKFFISIVFCS